MRSIKILILVIAIVLKISCGYAQIQNPVKWSYGEKKINETTAYIFIKATIDKGWHIYSINQADGGPVKTSFNFSVNNLFTVDGEIEEPTPLKMFDKTFNLKVQYFENEVIFKQRIKFKKLKITVHGTLRYMVCNDHQCLPPTDVSFNIN